MEKVIYEFRPYSYIILALMVSSTMYDSKLAIFSAVTLAFCGVYVILFRRKYRQRFNKP